MLRRAAFLLVSAVVLWAQSGLRYDQLRDIVRSSINQGLHDKDVAKYLRDQKLTFSLSAALIEEFQGLGAGPRTLEALRELQAASQGLPAPDLSANAPSEPTQPPPPSKEEQQRIIAEARQFAMAYVDRLPDFICLQITRRYVDPSGLEMDWLKYDEIKTRVSYVEGRENYELVSVNNQLTNKSYEELGGASSTGEFGSMLRELFDPATRAQFSWARHSLLRGRPVYVFNFDVPRARSRWRLSYQRQEEIIAGYAGLVYVDKETERVLRIAMEARDIPPSFPIRSAATTLDYDYVDISGASYLLPLKARMRMRESRLLSRNDVEFRLYRKFSAEASISFDEIEGLEPLPEDEGVPPENQ